MRYLVVVAAAFAAGYLTRLALEIPEPPPPMPAEVRFMAEDLDRRIRAHEKSLAELYSAALEVQARCPRSHLVQEASAP